MNDTKKPLLIALGGNAISRKGEEGNIDQQFARTRESTEILADLVKVGNHLVVTHGNGPQVGNILRRVELTAGEVYPIPMHMCVADTQASMGFMITQCLNNALIRRGVNKTSMTMVTHTMVDMNDPAFESPSKPIGKYMDEESANRLVEKHGWDMAKFDKNEYRRVVASPPPLYVLEMELIRNLVHQGEILVCGGGGGIPITKNGNGEYKGVDCVVDKDLTSALLATELEAETFFIATGVDKIALDYRTPKQRDLDTLNIAQALRYLAEGQFPPGTMGPKVQAGLYFLAHSRNPNASVIISRLESIGDALAGKTGTRILRSN